MGQHPEKFFFRQPLLGIQHVQSARREGMVREHLLMHSMQGREKTHRVALKSQQKVFWEVVMQQQRAGKSPVLRQLMPVSTHPFVPEKEKKKRRRIQKQFLVEGEGGREKARFSQSNERLSVGCQLSDSAAKGSRDRSNLLRLEAFWADVFQ